MKLRIPKDMRGTAFPRLLTIELAGFDIDFYLPALFYKVLADGRARARRTNDPTAVARYVDALVKHPSLEGFDGPDGRRVLDRLVRTSLVTMGRTGAASGGREQSLSLEPYTALAHKAGFPAENTRLPFPHDFPLPARIRTKKARTDHLLTGFWGQRRPRAAPEAPAALDRAA